jgi:hypothetical protein
MNQSVLPKQAQQSADLTGLTARFGWRCGTGMQSRAHVAIAKPGEREFAAQQDFRHLGVATRQRIQTPETAALVPHGSAHRIRQFSQGRCRVRLGRWQVPYFVWVSLATVLQLSITAMNWGRP